MVIPSSFSSFPPSISSGGKDISSKSVSASFSFPSNCKSETISKTGEVEIVSLVCFTGNKGRILK